MCLVSSRRLFLAVYAVSGAAGLLYEVAWTRLLTLHMGHTVAAASTVLAAYMGGMALGAFLAGRAATSLDPRRALRVYAALEVLVAICAILIPLVLGAFRPLLALAYADGQGGAVFGLTRLLTGLVALIVPTAAMGATFPVAVRWQVQDATRAGGEAGGLYAANAGGACFGALVAGFVLLPALGLWATTAVGCVLNVTAAAVALFVASRVLQPAPAGRPQQGPRQAMPAKRERARQAIVERADRSDAPEAGHLALAALALTMSGFAALVLEVAWTRILALAIGPTSYAFSLMLATFIGGLACGSTVGAWLAARVRRPASWLAGTLTVTGAAAFAALAVAGRLPLAVARAAADPQVTFGRMVATEWQLVAPLLVPLSAALGAAMPLAIATGRRTLETVPRDVALIYAMNTLGAIAGSLAAGFLLIPRFGLHTTTVGAAALALLGAAVVILHGVRGRVPKTIGFAAIAGVAVAALSLPGWDPALMASGAYKYAPYLGTLDLDWTLRAGSLLYYHDGAAGTVSVRRLTGTCSLAIDGKVDASNGGDMLTQQLLAHIPLLVHGSARQVCIIGLGSGVTLGAALAHPIQRADVLEISPDVVTAAGFFARENHNALADRRTHLVVGDGRSHVLLSSRVYDVIISEPSNPWMSGMATLFTREFFAAARDRLRPDGILCQWAHTYDISEGELRSIVATFSSVFPHAAAWLVGDADLLLIGSREPVGSRLDRMARGWQQPLVAASLAEVSATEPFSLLALCLGGDDYVKTYGRNARVQTDDRLALEYSAPRSIWGRPRSENLHALRDLAARMPAPPAVARARAAASGAEWRNLAVMQLKAQGADAAYEAFQRAAELDPGDRAALDGLARASGLIGRQAEATAFMERLSERRPNDLAPRLELSRLAADHGDTRQAVAIAAEALRRDPRSAEAREQLASVLADAQDLQRLRAVVIEMERDDPQRADTRFYAATVRLLEGNTQAAATLARQTLAIERNHVRAWILLAIASAKLGETREAREAFGRALDADPRNVNAYVNFGLLELQSGDLRAAGRTFTEALTIDPTSHSALEGLAEVLEQQGQPDRAARLRDRARQGGRDD